MPQILLGRTKRKRAVSGKELSVAQILSWADAFHERTGKWPGLASGPIPGSLGENWKKVDNALRIGLRGFPGGSSLANFLSEHRGFRNRLSLPVLTEEQILAWADRYRQRMGCWPTQTSGPVAERDSETWSGINQALKKGTRGLPGGSSLAQLLFQRRHVRYHLISPRLTLKQILIWADGHFRRTGKWPVTNSGPILYTPGDTWERIDAALRQGGRGLPQGWSLARLLAEKRGVRNRLSVPRLNEEMILSWAAAYYSRTGRWPNRNSGEISESPGDTWQKVHMCLRVGCRGLPGGSSLAMLLKQGLDTQHLPSSNQRRSQFQ